MIHEIKDVMTHDEALSTHAVERYLLGELTGLDRDQFEEHFFECTLCASELKAGASFVSSALPELGSKPRNVLPFAPPVRRAQSSWRLWGMAAALAACLALIVYQSFVLVPHLRRQLAEADIPAVLTPLVLANAGARGEVGLPTVSPSHGSYLLAVDIPPNAAAAVYRCTLVSSAGGTVWHLDVPVEQARDAVTLRVPAQSTPVGVYDLRVQAVPATGNGDSLVLLASYRFQVSHATAP